MTMSILPLQVDGLWLALPALTVNEILGQRRWVSIAGAPPELPGVIAWRGRAVAVLDLGRLVEGGKPMTVGEGRRRTLVVQHAGAILAVPVDDLREVREVFEDELHPAQQTRQRFAARELELDGVPMPLLDPAALLGSLALAGPEA
jgi:chemotaxis signal transduction protein